MNGVQTGPVGTQADYAKHRGVSRQAISKLVKQGKIPLESDKKINFAKADHALGKVMDPSRKLAAESAQQNSGADQIGDDLFDGAVRNVPVNKPDDQGADYQEHRALRESYNAELARLELEERQGKLINRREVEDAMVTAGRRIRQGLDGVASWADELDAAARNGGANAVRSVLKDKMRGLQDLIADSLVSLQDDDDGENDS
ncbi:hypothetical protein TH9_12250 [Thalassospira xiamenensis]|uniref:hypothetical protein n=1 Tax=Thalassospira xiamenensis TaxID=220697 RepID=UPI000DEE1487|nr:hypothetical protein [Thalassospira xiamenensis]RCK32496.1 hypothetical protein TH9_12250 [Thalassospira xiamenensis]